MELSHLFGLRGDLKNNVLYIDENTVMYPCGHTVVLFNQETRTQKFLFGTEKSEGITAIGLSQNKRYVAIAERGEKPTVSIYDVATMKRRRVIVCNDIEAEDIVHLSFSNDNKQLLVQASEPDWVLSMWAWEKNKCLVSTRASNMQGHEILLAEFCAWDSSVICILGENTLKFIRLVEGVVKPLSFVLKRDSQKYTCLVWLANDTLVVGSDTGELLVFENFEFKKTLPFMKHEGSRPKLEMLPIDSLRAYNGGFICGGPHSSLRFFESSEDPHEHFRHTKTLYVDSKPCKVTSMDISEDNLACSLSNNQTYLLNLSNTDIMRSDEIHFEMLSTSVHGPFIQDPKHGNLLGFTPSSSSFQITGLDSCTRKPLVATCGMDRVVRIWNYLDKTMVLSKEFQEEPHSLAFHPSGLHILVGFSDKLRLMNLLMDDIRTFKEFPIKSCKECAFSTGGQYFAVANGNSIQVFHSYTFECVYNLRGHAGRVNSISWTSDDRVIVSAGADGAVIRWSVKETKKDGGFISKTDNILCTASVDSDANVALCTSNPCTSIRELEMSSGNLIFQMNSDIAFEKFVVSKSGKRLYASMSSRSNLDQTLRVLKTGTLKTVSTVLSCGLPLTSNFESQLEQGNESLGEYSEEKETYKEGELHLDQVSHFTVHSEPVCRICTSHDDQYLFSVGYDGTLAIFQLPEEMDIGKKKNEKDTSSIAFAEEILVTKSDLEEKNTLMQELKNKVDELTLHNEYQLRLKDMNYNEKIKEVTCKFSDELEQDKEKYEALKREKISMESSFQDKLEALGTEHETEISNLEISFQSKIDTEVCRFDNLVKEGEAAARKWEEETSLLVESHDGQVNEITDLYEGKISSELATRDSIEQGKLTMVHTFEDNKLEVEDDANFEIEELKERYVSKLTIERESTLRLKGENGIMKKKFASLQRDIDEQKDRMRQLVERETDLYERIKGLEKDIHGHKKEIKEREETIQDKEKRIYDLKKKNQELEKFKFVLDYKIKELKRQIEPREKDISDMRTQIQEMDLELEQYQKSNAALDLMIGELKLKMEGMQKEITTQEKCIEVEKVTAKEYKREIEDTVTLLDDYRSLKSKIVEMYKSYCQSESKTEKVSEPPPNDYNRQREYLEKSVESLKRKLQKDMKLHQMDKMRLLRESSELTNEINVLRRELKSSRNALEKKQPDEHRIHEESNQQVVESSFVVSENNANREIELQRTQIQSLMTQIHKMELALGMK